MDNLDKLPKRILLADPNGGTTEVLNKAASELDAEIIVFDQPARLAMEAAKTGGDLVVIICPYSLLPLERLRNDPRTRHIPVLIAMSPPDDDAKKFQVLVGADHVLDYPLESEVLLEWVRAGLQGKFDRPPDGEFAEARFSERGLAKWAARVWWTDEDRCVIETDLRPSEGSKIKIEGSLFGDVPVEGTVRKTTKEGVYYNHENSVEVCVSLGETAESLAKKARDNHATQDAKSSIVVCCPSRMLTHLASNMDAGRFSLRWVDGVGNVAAAVARFKPVAVLVDPSDPLLQTDDGRRCLQRASTDGPPLFPLLPPEDLDYWEKLGARCPTLDVPALDAKGGWDSVLGLNLKRSAESGSGEKVYIKRESRLSHACLISTCELIAATEVTGRVRLEQPVAVGASVRLELPTLGEWGFASFHGRVVAIADRGRVASLVWIGVGGESERAQIRRLVQEKVMESRRRELLGSSR